MKQETRKDSKGNVFYFESDGIVSVQYYDSLQRKYIGEFNQDGHFVVSRREATNYLMHGKWPISSLVLNSIPDDKYVIFNTINGVYAIKKSEIAGTNSNPEVAMSIAYKYHHVHLVPQSIMRKAAFKNESGINQHKDADKPKEKPYINENNQLVMGENLDPRYKYWAGGQSLEATLLEIGASKEVASKYLVPYQVENWPERSTWRDKKTVNELTPEEKQSYENAKRDLGLDNPVTNNAIDNDMGW